jgi:hypothetical protein
LITAEARGAQRFRKRTAEAQSAQRLRDFVEIEERRSGIHFTWKAAHFDADCFFR